MNTQVKTIKCRNCGTHFKVDPDTPAISPKLIAAECSCRINSSGDRHWAWGYDGSQVRGGCDERALCLSEVWVVKCSFGVIQAV